MTATDDIRVLRIGTRLAAFITAGLFSMNGFSQGLYNTAMLHIDGAAVYVNGEISSEGTIENNGLVALTGDWDCRGSYAGEGTLEAYGPSPQKIIHHNQEVHRFVANGPGAKQLDGALTVGELLSLQLGIIEVSSDDALVMKENAVISGGSPESYVNGPLTVTGTGYKFFPIGKNATYAPIEFVDVAGTSIQYAVEVFEDAPPIAVDGVAVQRNHYWQREDLAGTFGGSALVIPFTQASFQHPDQVVLLAGSDWSEPFHAVTDLERSEETRISTRGRIRDRLILLGERSTEWNDAGFYFSTALSPHAKRVENRSIKIFGDRISSDQFRFQVFSRRGELIFESRSLDAMVVNGWDGRGTNGKPLMTGAYPYRLTGLDTNGRPLEKKGVITIVY